MDMEPQTQEQGTQQKGGSRNIIIGIIVLVIIVAGAWWALAHMGNTSAAGDTYPTGTDTDGDAASMVPANDQTASAAQAPMSATVTYTAQGFSPSTITIAKGGTVTWVNQSGSPMWVASGVHPTHTLYDGTSRTEHCAAGYTGPKPFDECSTGDAYSFTFNEVGNWKYHNHVGAEDTGTVMVVGQ